MRIGIPRGFFYYSYRPFVDTFFQEVGLPVEVSGETDAKTMEAGVAACVDEACFPVKVFHGHVKRLAERCDGVVLPRVMKTEFGESICPKVAGLTDMVREVAAPKKILFADPLYLDRPGAWRKSFWKTCKGLGVEKGKFQKSFDRAVFAQGAACSGLEETGYRYQIFLAGHPYHLYDSYVNRHILDKLHALDIGVVTEERVDRRQKDLGLRYADLMKQPYWSFFANIFGSVRVLRARGIQGVLYLSSFSCGTDSFTIEMLKNNLDGLPLLVLKLDEHTGEAGIETRLEAFGEVLRGKENL